MTDSTPSTPPTAFASARLRARLTRATGSLRALGTLVALGIIWLVFGLKSQYFFTTPNTTPAPPTPRNGGIGKRERLIGGIANTSQRNRSAG